MERHLEITLLQCYMAGLAKLRVERSNTQKLSAELYSTHMLGHMDTTNITHTCTYARTHARRPQCTDINK